MFCQQAPSGTLLPIKDPSTQDKPPRCSRRGRSPKSQPGSSPKCRKLMKLVASLLRVFHFHIASSGENTIPKTTCESVLFPAAAEWPKCRSRCAGTGGELEWRWRLANTKRKTWYSSVQVVPFDGFTYQICINFLCTSHQCTVKRPRKHRLASAAPVCAWAAQEEVDEDVRQELRLLVAHHGLQANDLGKQVKVSGIESNWS